MPVCVRVCTGNVCCSRNRRYYSPCRWSLWDRNIMMGCVFVLENGQILLSENSRCVYVIIRCMGMCGAIEECLCFKVMNVCLCVCRRHRSYCVSTESWWGLFWRTAGWCGYSWREEPLCPVCEKKIPVSVWQRTTGETKSYRQHL